MTIATSRIIVKGLPKWATERQVRDVFGAVGEVTDVRLMHTRSGVFRRFAFVGFATDAAASAAMKRLNGTFVDTSRIEVQAAQPRNSSELARPWSKYSAGSSLHSEYLERKSGEKQTDVHSIESGKGRQKEIAGQQDTARTAERKRKMLAAICGSDSDAEAPGESRLAKLVRSADSAGRAPMWADDRDADAAHSSSISDDDYQELPSGSVAEALSAEKSECNTRQNIEACEEDEVLSLEGPLQPEEHGDDTAARIMDTGRLFVRNLPYGCTEDEIRALFASFGELTEVHISISRETRRHKGFAHVLFMFPEHALRAYSELDGTAFKGRLLHILPGMERPAPRVDAAAANGGFGAKRDAKLRAEAQRGHNWNTLFVRQDTVMDAVAARLGVEKAALLSAERNADGLMATRVAVAEAALVQETRAALEAEGVVLASFENAAASRERSKTVILVKNLPYSTDEAQLRQMLEKHGELLRFVLPPTRAVAIVEFAEPADARRAFSSLAYTRYRDVPLYLEWAPVGAVLPKSKEAAAVVKSVVDSVASDVAVCVANDVGNNGEAVQVESKEAHDEAFHNGAHTLYVKNVSFSTAEDALRRVFSDAGPLRAVRIARKRGGLSLGYAFVEYADAASLRRALDTLQGHVVDGHALQLARAQGADAPRSQAVVRESVPEPEADARSTKLIVRNIPFDADEKEVRALFKAFAQVRRVRLPQRFDGRHRGFGFVDFATHTEAAHAKAVLGSTHLYGRHLVIEWASSEDAQTEDERIARLRAQSTEAAMAMGRSSSGRVRASLPGSDVDALPSSDSE